MADEFDVLKMLQEIEKGQEAHGAQVGVGDFGRKMTKYYAFPLKSL